MSVKTDGNAAAYVGARGHVPLPEFRPTGPRSAAEARERRDAWRKLSPFANYVPGPEPEPVEQDVDPRFVGPKRERKRRGPTGRRPANALDLDVQRMAAEYNAGHSTRDIAQRWGISHATVRRRLVAAGVQSRPSSLPAPIRRDKQPTEAPADPAPTTPARTRPVVGAVQDESVGQAYSMAGVT